jgi:hypothetical protein
MRKPLAVAVAALALTGTAHADQILGPGRIDSSNRVVLPGGPTLGRFQGGKYTATPDVLDGGTILGDGSGVKAKISSPGAVLRSLMDKLDERLSVRDFWLPSDGTDYLPAINRAVAALPNSGGSIHFPRQASCYLISNVAVIGDGSANGPSSKQNIRLVGDTGSGTGGQTGFGADKGTCIKYAGAQKIAGILRFNGPMAMSIEGITLEGGYLGYSASPTVRTTTGSNALTNLSSVAQVVVGSQVAGPGIPAGTIVASVSGTTATISANATTSGTFTATFTHNEATVDTALQLNHVFRSTLRNVGLKNARLGMRQDSYGVPNGFVTGSNDNEFANIWCENGAIAGGTSGSGCFDIGGADATGILDVARSTYTNLIGTYAGDPNATGLVLRYADNLTFRGGMMYSQREPGLGYALAIIPPTGTGREPAFPAEVTFQGIAMIGRIYQDPRWRPQSNGCFGLTAWPMHSGDMLDPSNPGRGSIPSFECFTGVDDRGVFFGLTQFRSWLDNSAGTPVAYDAAATFGRNTQLSQVTNTTAATVFQTHRIPAVAMRARNSKDYPSSTFPLTDAAQYVYDRVVKYTASGNYQNATGAQANQRFVISLGGAKPTVLFDSGAISLPNSGNYGSWHFEGDLSLSGSGSQSFSGRLTLGVAGTANGIAGAPLTVLVADKDDITVDMTADQFLTASVLPGTTGQIWTAKRSTIQVQ